MPAWSRTEVGDVNRDGVPDLAVGAPEESRLVDPGPPLVIYDAAVAVYVVPLSITGAPKGAGVQKISNSGPPAGARPPSAGAPSAGARFPPA
jgi:hypothetical protein